MIITAPTTTQLLSNYSRTPIHFEMGEGVFLYDMNGHRYLDALCGIAVTPFGHNHSGIRSSVERQLDRYWHISNLFESADQELLASKMLAKAQGLNKVFFCNSGTEANEAAIKFARKWGNGRKEIISAGNSFHGRTYGSLSATGKPALQKNFGPMLEGFVSVPFNDLSAIEKAITADTVAVMLEPIQGEGGIVVPSSSYLEKVSELCKQNNLLLIVDEVQTGNGRTGKYFAYQHCNAEPDIVTTAKGIANGLPLGAVLVSSKVADIIMPGDHGSTFGGNPIAVAAALAVVDLLDEELLESNMVAGEKLKLTLKDLKLSAVKEVRGIGMMIGIALEDGYSAKKIAERLLEEGLIIGTSGDSVLRILPPYIITDEEMELLIVGLQKILNI